MPSLHDILTQQAEYTRNSGYSVDVDTSLDCVAIIEDATGETKVFIQDSEGRGWIEECKKTWNKVGTLDIQTVYDAFASQYVDIIE